MMNDWNAIISATAMRTMIQTTSRMFTSRQLAASHPPATTTRASAESRNVARICRRKHMPQEVIAQRNTTNATDINQPTIADQTLQRLISCPSPAKREITHAQAGIGKANGTKNINMSAASCRPVPQSVGTINAS